MALHAIFARSEDKGRRRHPNRRRTVDLHLALTSTLVDE